tara:strand:- start:680 stop:4177 length:3498 start_codon:yes stop_codon:yes gene_type:complete
MAEELKYRVRVLGIDELVGLNKEIQKNADDLRKKRKALKDDKQGQEENMKQVIELTDKLKQQRKEFREGSKVQKEVQTQTKKSTSFTMKMAAAFGVASLAVDGLKKASKFLGDQIKESVVVFKEFDFQMAKVRAISGATDSEFQALKKSAEELGRTTFFTATQVAELQTNLSKLGFTSIEILDAQAATLATATAAGEDLARTATVMGSTIRGFGLDASEATRVADVMATAFTGSALDIEKFQTSMTKVAPIAKMAGFEIEGTTAILASLTDAGIEASIAGTSLRNIFLRLADPTSDLSKRLGGSVSSVDELIPRLKELQDANIDLADVLGITDRRTAAAFGRILDSGEGIQIFTDALRNSEGAAQDMADIVGDSLQGAFLRFKSAVDGFRIALMDGLGESMQSVVDGFAKFFNALADEKNISRLKTLGKAIRNTIILLASYTIGVKASALATTLFGTASMTAGMTLKGQFLRSLVLAKKGLVAFRLALIKTGIGAIVVAVASLATKLIMFDSSINDVNNTLDEFNNKLDKGNIAYEGQSKNAERLIQIKKELNKITDEEGNLLSDSAFQSEKHNKLKREESVLIVKLNRDMKKYTDHLLTEKSTIDDITEATKTLIKTMKQRQAAQIFEELSSDLLKTSLAVEKFKKDFTEGTFGEMTFKDEAQAMKGLEVLLNRLGKRGTKTFDDIAQGLGKFLGIGSSTALSEMNDFIEQFMESTDINLGTLKKFFKDTQGVYDSEMTALRAHIEEQTGIDPATVLFGGGDSEKKDEKKAPDGFVITSEALQKTMKQERAKILKDQTLFAEERTMKLLLLEQDYLEKVLALQNQHKKDTEDTQIKIAQNEAKILEEGFKGKLKLLEEQEVLRKLKLEELRTEGVDDTTLKAMELEGEAQFLNSKLLLHLQYSKDFMDISAQLDENEEEQERNRKARFQQTVNEVNNLGQEMQNLGAIMGENHALTKIGIKISQAAALANNIQTASEKIKALSLIKTAGAESAAGVATQAKLMFPANIAAIAATLAAVVSAMQLFGVGFGGGNVDEEGPEQFFAKGGLTKGGMFRGRSHANGGVKFAVGGRIHEAEGGEAIINKKSTARFRPILSAINSYNGNGVKFADGGVISSGEKFALGGELANIQQMVSGGSMKQKVVMVESDVTSTQSKVSSLESQARF